MLLLRLLLRTAFRHRLRTGLTIVGLVVAVCAFGLLRTLVDAWYAGVAASSGTRLVTRSAVSLTFSWRRSFHGPCVRILTDGSSSATLVQRRCSPIADGT